MAEGSDHIRPNRFRGPREFDRIRVRSSAADFSRWPKENTSTLSTSSQVDFSPHQFIVSNSFSVYLVGLPTSHVQTTESKFMVVFWGGAPHKEKL